MDNFGLEETRFQGSFIKRIPEQVEDVLHSLLQEGLQYVMVHNTYTTNTSLVIMGLVPIRLPIAEQRTARQLFAEPTSVIPATWLLDNIVLIHTIRMGTISAPKQSPSLGVVFKSFLITLSRRHRHCHILQVTQKVLDVIDVVVVVIVKV